MDIKRLFGVYRAVVTANNDPLKQRRLKLSIQTTPGEITDWVWPMEATNTSYDPPVLGQGVWVQFIGGDPEYPVWYGTFGKNQGKNKKLFIKALPNTTALTGITDSIILSTNSDGTQELDLIATLLAISNKLQTLDAAYLAYVATHP